MRNTILIVFGLAAMLGALANQDAEAQLVIADDFFYNQPTKAFGAGGGFTGQGYAGGQNGSAGQWLGPWVSTGDGVITGSDITEEAGYNVEDDQFLAATRNGLSVNYLERTFSIGDTPDDVLYFGVTIRNREELPTGPLFTLNDPGGTSQISMGGSGDGGFTGILGETSDFIEGPFLTDGIDPYKLIGKLELNASNDDERLTVWLDPTGVEMAEETFSVEADVLASFNDLVGTLRLDHNFSGSVVYWDDVALATSWEAAASVDVPRATLLMDPESGEAAITNNTELTFDAIYYDVSSTGGQINTENWNGLQARGIPGWVASPASDELIIESNFRDSTLLSPGDTLALGAIAPNGEGDLAGSLGTSEGLLNVLTAEFGPVVSEEPCDPNTLGDFDGNGTVEFADFLTLSSNFGLAVADHTGGDADCNGTVEFADFLILSSNFGQSVGGAQSVPEPIASSSFVAGLLILFAGFRRRRLS